MDLFEALTMYVVTSPKALVKVIQRKLDNQEQWSLQFVGNSLLLNGDETYFPTTLLPRFRFDWNLVCNYLALAADENDIYGPYGDWEGQLVAGKLWDVLEGTLLAYADLRIIGRQPVSEDGPLMTDDDLDAILMFESLHLRIHQDSDGLVHVDPELGPLGPFGVEPGDVSGFPLIRTVSMQALVRWVYQLLLWRQDPLVIIEDARVEPEATVRMLYRMEQWVGDTAALLAWLIIYINRMRVSTRAVMDHIVVSVRDTARTIVVDPGSAEATEFARVTATGQAVPGGGPNWMPLEAELVRSLARGGELPGEDHAA